MKLNQIDKNKSFKSKKRIGRGIGSGKGKTSGTVSYTHLRANETVLDIVFSVVLEKK